MVIGAKALTNSRKKSTVEHQNTEFTKVSNSSVRTSVLDTCSMVGKGWQENVQYWEKGKILISQNMLNTCNMVYVRDGLKSQYRLIF